MRSFCHPYIPPLLHKNQDVLVIMDELDGQNLRQNGISNIRQKHAIARKVGQSSFCEPRKIYAIHRDKKGFQLLPPSEATLEFVRPKVRRRGG